MWDEKPKNSGVGSRNRGEVTTLHGWNKGKRSGTRGCRMSFGVDNIIQIIYKEYPSLQFLPEYLHLVPSVLRRSKPDSMALRLQKASNMPGSQAGQKNA
jgi:hypothetical protein